MRNADTQRDPTLPPNVPHNNTSQPQHSQSPSTSGASHETGRYHSEETPQTSRNENGPIKQVQPQTKNERFLKYKQLACLTTPQHLSPVKQHNSLSLLSTTTVHTNYQLKSYHCYIKDPQHRSSHWKNCSHKCYNISMTLPNF